MTVSGQIPANISILCVEDEKVSLDLLCSSLAVKYAEASIYCAANGAEGLALYKEHLPEIVVTDISMPVMDGLQMAAEIKSLNSDVVIIAVTALSDTESLLKAIEIGIHHYVMKPLDFNRLFEGINHHIATINLKRQLKVQNERIRKLSRALEQSPCAVIITNEQGIIEYINPKFTEQTGYSSDETIGKHQHIPMQEQMATGIPPDRYDRIIPEEIWHGEQQSTRKNGEVYWESVAISAIYDDEGAISNYVGVMDDISARKEAEAAIAELNAKLAARAVELEIANQDLDAFNYSVAHDLRSPVTGISGFCSVILEKYGHSFDENCGRFFSIIQEETLRMDQLISTLLDFARISRKELNFQKVDLSKIALLISLELKIKNPERKAEFKIADNINCYGDAGLLQVVMNNLLGNAWKYSMKQERTIIEFGSTKGDNGLLTCYVCDNGVGFDADLAEKLFYPFQRLHSEEEFAGHGIGLTTVQRIIQRHGGSIWAESEPGKGATFYFTLKSAD
jgi:PAS domain S-box-containing protein